MTDDELKAARKLCEQATPGPWEVGEDERECAATLRVRPCRINSEPEAPVDVIIPFGRAFSDARFIAASRTWVPQLLAEVARLRRALKAERAQTEVDVMLLKDERDTARDLAKHWEQIARGHGVMLEDRPLLMAAVKAATKWRNMFASAPWSGDAEAALDALLAAVTAAGDAGVLPEDV